MQSAEAARAQERQAENAMELKSAELIFGARSPYMARARAYLSKELKPGGISSKLLVALGGGDHVDPGNAVAELRWELRQLIFKEIAAQYKEDPQAVLDLASQIYDGDQWWLSKIDLSKPHQGDEVAPSEKS